MSPRIAVFAKVPSVGRVKTRLASAIGPEAALACYLRLLDLAIEATADFDTEVWFDGDVGADWNERGMAIRQQSGEDLGERMHGAFVDGVTLVIGSDIPLISKRYIVQAFELLRTTDVVLGPTEDGGYCLIGMGHPHDELFHGISWSTSHVFDETVQVCRRIGIKCEVLPLLWDVDDYCDYQRWLEMRPDEPTIVPCTS